MADDDVQLLHVNGETFDPDDLTYGEMREVRTIVRSIWDTDEGDFDWEEVSANDVMLATVVVFVRRSQPEYSIDEAMNLKPRDVYKEDEPPPTKRGSARKPTSAKAGAPS